MTGLFVGKSKVNSTANPEYYKNKFLTNTECP